MSKKNSDRDSDSETDASESEEIPTEQQLREYEKLKEILDIHEYLKNLGISIGTYLLLSI